MASFCFALSTLLSVACDDATHVVRIEQPGFVEFLVPESWVVSLPPPDQATLDTAETEPGLPIIVAPNLSTQGDSEIAAFSVFYRRVDEGVLDPEEVARGYLAGARGEASDLDHSERGTRVSFTATITGRYSPGTNFANLVAVIASKERLGEAWLVSCLATAAEEDSADLVNKVVERCEPVVNSFTVQPPSATPTP